MPRLPLVSNPDLAVLVCLALGLVLVALLTGPAWLSLPLALGAGLALGAWFLRSSASETVGALETAGKGVGASGPDLGPFEALTKRIGEQAVLEVSGPLTYAHVDAFEVQADQTLRSGDRFLLDLKGLTALDPAGGRAVLAFAAGCGQRSSPLLVLAPEEGVATFRHLEEALGLFENVSCEDEIGRALPLARGDHFSRSPQPAQA